MTIPKIVQAGTFVLAASLCLPASAGYRGHSDSARAEVLSVDPIVETFEVDVPREVCRQEQVREVSRRSRTPGIVGAIIGGAIGHSVGHGKKNKKIGTAVGAVLGGTIGADISRRNHDRQTSGYYQDRYDDRAGRRYGPVRYRTERSCRLVSDYRTEQRISGYDVSYAYGGQTYSTVLDHDPGRYLDVRVSVTPVE